METFLISPLVVGAVIATLGLLINILDRIVNNYGDVVVKINQTKDLTVKGGAPLLRSLSQEKIFIPSACGGKGTCGACKTVVRSDVGPLLPTEIPYLSKEEQKGCVRLACQVKVKKDIDIEIPEELFNVQEYDAVVKSKCFVTYDIIELYLKLNKPVQFKPGMYMQLVIPSFKAKNKGDLSFKGTTMRAYSISSPPTDNEHAEFLVRLMPPGKPGIATSYIHQHLELGMNIQAIGPFGDFYLRENTATMICIGGGSGMAPFRSILRYMKEENIGDREVWYFFGCRDYPDIYYLKEMRSLEKEWPNFRCIYALSDEKLHEPEEWDESVLGPKSAIVKGRIDHVVDRYMNEEISHDAGFEGYLCGGPLMIKGCTAVLLKQGVPEDRMYFDEF